MKVEKNNLANDILFSLAMKNEELCKEVIKVLLDRDIGEVKSVETQKSQGATVDAKTVKFDVMLKTEDGNYNLEMQNAKIPYLATLIV